jgi:hypothetical protein
MRSARRLAGKTLLIGALFASTPGILAQQRAPTERQPESATLTVVAQDQDAKETREKLEVLLKKLPPAVGRVLRTDPSLMSNDSYLATYPALAAFIKQHPEIRNSPSFYLERIQADFWNPQPVSTPRQEALRIWNDILAGVALLTVFATVTYVLTWVIRTTIDYRRWHRVSKTQTDVHTKLLDRLTSNEDLMAYMQSPAGRRFLESAPLAIDSPTRRVGAPYSRILTSMQIGIVLGVGALGLLYVSNRVIEEVAPALFAIGVLALAVGVGFVVSAAASFLLSQRLGLFEPAGAPREHDEVASR